MSVSRFAGFVGLTFALSLAGRAQSVQPWDTPFDGRTAEILSAATRASAEGDGPSMVLLEEGAFSFDEAGRTTRRLRYVVRIAAPSAVADWSTLETTWAPWHQSRPVLRARVIAPDGSVHELDPKTVSDAPAADDNPDVFSDRRVVRAPLPALSPGAVLEEEVTVRDLEPFFPAGTVGRFLFGGALTQETRLTIRHPESLPMRTWASPRLALPPRRTAEGGWVTLVFEAGKLEPLEDLEQGVPADDVQSRIVFFSTGESWAAVARRYARIVDGQLGAAAAVATRAPSDRDERIRKALARIQREIRYTGVEFSEASIVPRTPEETLRRGYGDCKDKAALLVARLREEGIPAFMALLDAGPGIDVRPDLPGLAFDHVIVHVPGPPALWIDPTDEFARAGELPFVDQGRLALVAAEGTAGLVRTPETSSAENRRVETREFRLQDEGPAHLAETREATGGLEQVERERFAGGDRKRLQEWAESYAREEYLAKGATRYQTGDPRDLTQPFRVRIEADKAGRGVTADEDAAAAFFAGHLLRRLPSALLHQEEAEEPGEGEPAPRKKKGRSPRARPFRFDEPFVESWVYRVVPPAGYVPAPLPESAETKVGTGTLSQAFRAEVDGSISATVTFDSGPRRITAAEFEGYRAAVAELSKRPATFLRFSQAGMAHLHAGRTREALAEFRRLSAERPGKAVPHARLAAALLQAGLGETARSEARKAVALEPGSARVQLTLGWVLQHDLIGRRFGPGFDREGALSAYRRARELDPKNAVGRADLAILLEHDGQGLRYSPKADLAAAVAEYQAIRKELKDSAYNTNLVICLYQARRFDELAETARAMERSPLVDESLVLAAAARGGADAARQEAARLIPDAARRRESLERVAQTLVQLRIYPEAAALLSDAASGSPKAADLRGRADLIGRTRRWDAGPLPPEDPRSVVKQLSADIMRGDLDRAVALFTKETARSLSIEEQRLPLRRLVSALRKPMSSSGIAVDVLIDLSLSAAQFAVEGDDERGYRIRVRAQAAGQGMNEAFFVVRQDGAYRILSSSRTPNLLGEEALRRAAASKVESARLWLDWAREEVRGGDGDDPLAGSPFALLWIRGEASDPARVELAARVLAARGDHPAPHVEALRRARDAAREPEERRAIDLALALAYIQEKRFDELLPVARRLEEDSPRSASAFDLHQLALERLRRLPEARRHAEERLARRADDPLAVRSLARLAYESGDFAGGDRLLRRLAESGSATSTDYNQLAWAALFVPPVGPGAIEDGQRAVEMSRSTNYAHLHTLAAVYADVGRTAEARDLILKALDLSGNDEPAPSDWLVLARLAEQYGEVQAAGEGYRKVKPAAEEGRASLSSWTLAERRLRLLGAAAVPKT